MQTHLLYFRSSFAKTQRRRLDSDSPFCIAWLSSVADNSSKKLPPLKQNSARSGIVVMNTTEFETAIDELLQQKVCVGHSAHLLVPNNRQHERLCVEPRIPLFPILPAAFKWRIYRKIQVLHLKSHYRRIALTNICISQFSLGEYTWHCQHVLQCGIS